MPIKQPNFIHTNISFPISSSNSLKKDESKLEKEIYGQLFRSEILHQIYVLCESSQKEDYEATLKILAKKTNLKGESLKILLQKMIEVLQSLRLTINFDFSKLNTSSIVLEVLNCFASRQKPNEIPNYNVGRAHVEEQVFDLNGLFKESEHEKFGRYAPKDSDQTIRSADFQWTSRPCYAALDFLENDFGGAPMYGKSFIILKDHVKHNCTFSPFDTYLPPILKSINKEKIATFFHFSKLIRYSQNDWFRYNCLESLINKANGKDFIPHGNYGQSTGNYIETHIYSRVLFSRDVKQICLSKEEFDKHSNSQQQEILAKIDEINSSMGDSFIIFINKEKTKKLIKKTWVTRIINFFSNIKKWIIGKVVTSEQNKSPINIKSSILTPENSDLVPKLVDCQEKSNNENIFVEKQIASQVNAWDNLPNNKILVSQNAIN